MFIFIRFKIFANISSVLLLFNLLFSSVLLGSDTLEDVHRAYTRAFKNNQNIPLLQTVQVKRKEEYNINLYHALNAAITLISEYLKGIYQQDNPCNNKYLYLLEKENHCENRQNIICLLGENKVSLPRDLYYDLISKRMFVDLRFLVVMLITCKRHIFPENTVESYDPIQAAALEPVVTNFYIMRQNCLKETETLIQTDIQQENYAHGILSALYDIKQYLPSEKQFLAILKEYKHLYTQNRLTQSREISNRIYDGIIDYYENKVMPVYITLKHFLLNLDLLQVPEARETFYASYRKLLRSSLPGPKNTKINFTSFTRIPDQEVMRLPDISDYYVMYEGNVVLVAKKDDPIFNDSEDEAAEKVNQVNIPQESQKITNTDSQEQTENTTYDDEIVQSESPNDIEGEEYEVIYYDEKYWKNENKRHQLRKAQELFDINPVSILPSDYEINLFSFLRDNIFTYRKIKKNKFIKQLKEFGFLVRQNTKGNGSVYHVKPSESNPLFSNNDEYKDAFFNVHLPHQNSIIPPRYFAYIRSGFENVFGLSEEYINRSEITGNVL